jgi:hypothetical protein
LAVAMSSKALASTSLSILGLFFVSIIMVCGANIGILTLPAFPIFRG